MLPETAAHPAGLYLRTLHGEARVREVARLEVIKDGMPLPFETAGIGFYSCVWRLKAGG